MSERTTAELLVALRLWDAGSPRLLVREAANRIEALESLADALAEDLGSAEEQWGDDYLWQKWNLSESMDRWRASRGVTR
jgi:hypothetical protein